MSGYSAVCDCGRVDHRAVVILPGDGVFIDRRGVGRGVLSFTGDSNDFRSPSREGVGVLCVGRLGRIGMSGYSTVCDRGGVDHGAVVVLPGDGVTPGDRGKVCCVGHIAGYRRDRRRPASEDVCVLCVRFLDRIGMARHRTISVFLSLHRFINDPCDGVLVECSVVSRSVLGITGDCSYLGIPTCEGVGVLRGRGLGRIGMSGYSAVCGCGRVDHCAVIVLPCDGVFIDRRGVSRGIGRVSGDGNDCRRPACERVGVLCGRGLGRIGMSGYRAVCDRGGVDHGTIVVLPGDGVFVDRRGVSRGIGRVSGDGNDLRIPACEGVGILRGRGLGRISMSGYRSVCGRGGVDHGAIVVLPCDGVFIDRRGVSRGVGRVSSDSNDCRRPACEGVGILRSRGLGRIGMSGYSTVLDRGRVDHGAIVVLPGDGVAPLGRGEVRCVSRIAGDRCDLGSPACEGVCVFSGRFPDGSIAGVGRSCALGNFGVDLQYRTVPVFPGDGVRIELHADVVIPVRRRAVVESYGFGSSGKSQAVGISLAVRVVRLKDRFCPR